MGCQFEFVQVNGDAGVSGHHAQYRVVSECETDREYVWPSPTICMETIAKATALNMTHAKCQLVIVSLEFQSNFKNIILMNDFVFDFTAFLGWSPWSDWSKCNEDGERIRYRKCLRTDPDQMECQGNERDIRGCRPEMANGNFSGIFT